MPRAGNKFLQNLQDLHLRADFEGYFGRTIFYCLKLRELREAKSSWEAGCPSSGTNMKQTEACGRKSQQRIWN